MINSNVTNQPSSSNTLPGGGTNHIAPAQPESSTCHSAPRNDPLARSLQEANSLVNSNYPFKLQPDLYSTGFKMNLDPAAKKEAEDNQALINKVCEENKGFRGVVYDPKTGSRLCEGTLISPDLFLTTGHHSILSSEFISEIKIDFNIKDKNGNSSSLSTAHFVCGGCHPENDFAIFSLDLFSPKPQINAQNQSYASITHEKINFNKLIAVILPLPEQTFFYYTGQNKGQSKDEEPLGPGCSGLSVFNLEGKLLKIHSYVNSEVNRYGPTVRMILDCLYKNNQDIYHELRKHHDTLPEIPSFDECPSFAPIDPRTDFEAYKKAYQDSQNFYNNYEHEGKNWGDKLKNFTDIKSGKIQGKSLTAEENEQYNTSLKLRLQQLKIGDTIDTIFTEKFKNDHLLVDINKSKDIWEECERIANTREFDSEKGDKNSSLTYIACGAAAKELKHALNKTQTLLKHLIINEVNELDIIKINNQKPLFLTQGKYHVYNTPLTIKLENKRNSLKAYKEIQPFEFGVKIENGFLKISHFEKSLRLKNQEKFRKTTERIKRYFSHEENMGGFKLELCGDTNIEDEDSFLNSYISSYSNIKGNIDDLQLNFSDSLSTFSISGDGFLKQNNQDLTPDSAHQLIQLYSRKNKSIPPYLIKVILESLGNDITNKISFLKKTFEIKANQPINIEQGIDFIKLGIPIRIIKFDETETRTEQQIKDNLNKFNFDTREAISSTWARVLNNPPLPSLFICLIDLGEYLNEHQQSFPKFMFATATKIQPRRNG